MTSRHVVRANVCRLGKCVLARLKATRQISGGTSPVAVATKNRYWYFYITPYDVVLNFKTVANYIPRKLHPTSEQRPYLNNSRV